MMKFVKIITIFSVIALGTSCKKTTTDDTSTIIRTEHHKDASGFSYETVINDPTGLRLYTLDNGLKVYLSKNEEEPKIQTFIAVRAGSIYDPKESTGLAHYLEHMVFKGTSKIGTQDYEKEKVLLDTISNLYETHKATANPQKKKELYKRIDEVSQEASKISIPNEYDKMISSLGAERTNAWTWFEETVYTNKIPANELDKWLHVEKERFGELVLRLFHTELEAVYEEFNRAQDNDGWKFWAENLKGLFPKHPYGQQPTIGISEHLKNPSMVAIHNYFNTYYVPNNMAMVLVGDLDFDTTIKKVANSFGKLKKKPVSHPELPKEDPITTPVTMEVFGPTSTSVSISYRADAIGTADEKLLTLADMLLTNGNAGLIDLNLNQKQVVQKAGCSPMFLNDYGFHRFIGTPKEGQTLDEVKELILGEIEKLKKGAFEDWMLSAVINDLELSQTKQYENSTALANAYVSAFIHRQDWAHRVQFLEELRAVSKAELVAFANRFYGNNYVTVYKRKGVDETITKVENPSITPVQLNRDKQSAFFTEFNQLKTPSMTPKYIDYDSAIAKVTLENGMELAYVENKNNELFNLDIIFDMGQDHDKKATLAAGYLDYLGTDTYSPEALKKEFYKLGINYAVKTESDRTTVGISGLRKNMDKGLQLLEQLWENAKPNQEAYNKYIAQIAKGRQDGKTQKRNILWNGLKNYGEYGENSPLRNIYSIAELQAINPAALVRKIKELKTYQQRAFYYGKDVQHAVAALTQHHAIPETLLAYPKKAQYLKKETGGNVYFVDYDMVQSELLFLAKGETFDPAKIAATELFNTYFGSGLSSILFQEIRESKSLAYSAFSAYGRVSKKEDPNYVYAYIGTQANKMPQAVDAMMELMTNMPEAQQQFDAAKEAALKQIAAERITKQHIFWNFEKMKKLGITKDNRAVVYNTIQKMTMEDLKTFFETNIKGKAYDIMVIGNKKDVDMNALSKLGRVQEMDVDYLFNYKTDTGSVKS